MSTLSIYFTFQILISYNFIKSYFMPFCGNLFPTNSLEVKKTFSVDGLSTSPSFPEEHQNNPENNQDDANDMVDPCNRLRIEEPADMMRN